ncbi:MAG TPA: response regulator transcription factor [Gaiellaceae bacterium]|nr:response regulator transcription factor [Gaiellaceae bacterium]
MHEPKAPSESRERRAVVADDDPYARRVLCQVLEEAGIVVVAEASDGAEAVELTRRHRPDVVLMDVAMPRVDGIAATRQIVGEYPGQLVILVSGSADEDLAVLGLRLGARGWLGKDIPLESLARSVLGALDGEAAVSRKLTREVIDQLHLAPTLGAGYMPIHGPLTKREWQVLDLICAGRTTEEMAKTFVVSEETIRSHVKRILHKLGVNSRAQAVATVRRMRSVDV